MTLLDKKFLETQQRMYRKLFEAASDAFLQKVIDNKSELYELHAMDLAKSILTLREKNKERKKNDEQPK